MRTKPFLFAVATVGALAVGACGSGDDKASSSSSSSSIKTVEVKMVDIGFEPKQLEVSKGQEIRFVFKNSGKVEHEAFVGMPKDQVAHENEMKKGNGASSDMGGMGHGGDNPTVTVKPGAEADLTHKFSEAGTYEIGCHEPGHYDAGMKITVTVS